MGRENIRVSKRVDWSRVRSGTEAWISEQEGDGGIRKFEVLVSGRGLCDYYL